MQLRLSRVGIAEVQGPLDTEVVQFLAELGDFINGLLQEVGQIKSSDLGPAKRTMLLVLGLAEDGWQLSELNSKAVGVPLHLILCYD